VGSDRFGQYSEAMIGRAALTACVLVLGGALLGGCGGGTKTVTVSGAAAPTTGAGGASAPRTTSTAGTTTGTSAQGTTGAGGRSAGGTGAGGTSAGSTGARTTRTAPAPAFTHTGAQPSEAAPGAATAAAAVLAHGYTPDATSEYHPTQTLRVLLGTRTGSADGYNQRAFFFLDGRYLGTDSSEPSATLRIVSQSDTEVALAYALYRPHDALCCPSGGQAVVHFQLNNGKLVPLEPIPPANSASGLARQ
jgi:hypothetical protein